ncbi:MAG: hypothetical protein R2755_18075 [Acidimicrobiales bacterium]
MVWYRNYRAGDDLDDLLTDRAGVRRSVSLPPGTVRDEHAAEARAVAGPVCRVASPRWSATPSRSCSCR